MLLRVLLLATPLVLGASTLLRAGAQPTMSVVRHAKGEVNFPHHLAAYSSRRESMLRWFNTCKIRGTEERGHPLFYWAHTGKGYDRPLTCTNENPDATGIVQLFGPTLATDANLAFRISSFEVSRIMYWLDDVGVKEVRVDHPERVADMMSLLESIPSTELQAVILRGHGDRATMELSSNLKIRAARPWKTSCTDLLVDSDISRVLETINEKLDPERGVVVLDACAVGGQLAAQLSAKCFRGFPVVASRHSYSQADFGHLHTVFRNGKNMNWQNYLAWAPHAFHPEGGPEDMKTRTKTFFEKLHDGRVLDLTDESVTPEALSYVMKSIKASPHVIHLILSGKKQLGVAGAVAFADALSQTKLEQIDLSGTSMGAEGFAAIAKALPGTDLGTLSAGSNSITDNGIAALEATLKHLSVDATKLTNLGLGGNYITDNGIALLARILPKTKIAILRLGGNHITDRGAEALAKALRHANCLVAEIDLRGNKDVSIAGARAVLASAPALRKLDVRATAVKQSECKLLQRTHREVVEC